jgi:kinesin family member C2/C3
MFVHISPESEALAETISTLKFAERVSTVELGASRVNKDSGEVKVLKEQITSLKATLARMKDGESEHFKQRANSMTDLPKLKSLLSSSVPTIWTSGGRKLPRNNSSSLDPEDIYRNLHAGVNGNEDDRESFSGSMDRDESCDSLMGQSEVESKQSSSPLLSPTYLFAASDYDELELATSEGSESDLSWQSHSPRPKKSIHLKPAKNLKTRY